MLSGMTYTLFVVVFCFGYKTIVFPFSINAPCSSTEYFEFPSVTVIELNELQYLNAY